LITTPEDLKKVEECCFRIEALLESTEQKIEEETPVENDQISRADWLQTLQAFIDDYEVRNLS